MSYEPRGKMVDVMRALTAETDRCKAFHWKVMTELLGCKPFPSNVAIYTESALRNGALHVRSVGKDTYYSASPIDDAMLKAAGAKLPEPGAGLGGSIIPSNTTPQERARALEHPRALSEVPFVPKPMVPPRGSPTKVELPSEFDRGYTPRRERVEKLMKSMREAPDVPMSRDDAAKVLNCMPSQVSGLILPEIDDEKIFSKAIAGTFYYKVEAFTDHDLAKIRGTPIPSPAPTPVPTPKPTPAPAPTTAPASAPKPAPTAAPVIEVRAFAPCSDCGAHDECRSREKCAGFTKGIVRQEAESRELQGRIQAVKASDVHADEEDREFDAAVWLNGDLVVYGAVETRDGGMRFTKDQVDQLKRLIAWSAA